MSTFRSTKQQKIYRILNLKFILSPRGSKSRRKVTMARRSQAQRVIVMTAIAMIVVMALMLLESAKYLAQGL
jgi:hypothetical protein